MAVTIDIELQAGDVAAEITGIATALETLEATAGDFDLDFDNLDVDEISGEIGNMVEMLEGLDLDLSSLEEDISRIENLDDIEVEANINSPDGTTNDSDSTGRGPPASAFNMNWAEMVEATDASTDLVREASGVADGSGSSSISNLMDKLETRNGLAPGSVQGFRNDAGSLTDLQKSFFHKVQGNDHPTSNLDPPSELINDGISLGTDQGFGMEGPDMSGRRNFYLGDAEIESLKEIDLGFDGGMGREMKQRLQQDLAGMYGGDFMNVPKNDNMNVHPLNRRAMMNLDAFEGSLGEGDMESAVAKRGEFGTEPLSMMKKRREMLDEIELEGVGINYDVGGGFPDKPGRSNQDIIDGNRVLSKLDGVKSKSDAFEALGDATDGLSGKFRKLKPTMGKYMQLLAALIPVALALGTQLLGVAAAMGAVAAAGGAIMGLGLLGHGETMAGSMAEAKQQVRSLKQELFDMAQPTMQQFAPMQSRMFDAMPEGLGGVFEEMEGFTAFEDTLFELGGALAGGMEEAIAIINENEQAISQLTTRFGDLIGSGALNFFEWLIQAAAKNQDLLVGLGKDMLKLAVAAYNVSMAIAKVLTAFSPLFDLLVFISEVLNSGIIIGLVAMVGWLFVLGKAAGVVYALYAGFMTLASGIADAALMMFGYEMSTWGAVAATLALVAAIGALTLGAATVIGGAVTAGAMGGSGVPSGPGGGPGGPGGMGGGGKTVYNDNRSYQISGGNIDDYATQKGVEDTVKRVNETNEAQSLPEVQTSSESSDGKDASKSNK